MLRLAGSELSELLLALHCLPFRIQWPDDSSTTETPRFAALSSTPNLLRRSVFLFIESCKHTSIGKASLARGAYGNRGF